MSNVNAQIEAIIQKRSAIMDKIRPEQDKWTKNAEIVSQLDRKLRTLRSSLEAAVTNNKDSDNLLPPLLDDVRQKFPDLLSKLDNQTKRAQEKLKNLVDRCDRKTLNISVAGLTRSGKSTSLKTLLDLDDDDIIPNSGTLVTTAGKSIIVSVLSKDEQQTEVEFHTEKSFMECVVAPFSKRISGLTFMDFDDFINFDLLAYKNKLIQDDMQEEVETIKIYVDQLRKIQDNIRPVRSYLGREKHKIDIHDTAKYISYQQNGTNLCYAVKQVKIYCFFPNNEIKALQLIDLPGLGTCSESERRCFIDGFNYAVDMVLMIQRPTGTGQSGYPTDEDRHVFDILNSTYEKNWKDCVFLFQNTGAIKPQIAQDVLQVIKKALKTWEEEEGKVVPLMSGDAMDRNFMQKELLPAVLDCMMERLPKFDEELFSSVQNRLKTLEEEFNNCSDIFYRELKKADKSIKVASNSFNEKAIKLEEIRKTITTRINSLVNNSFAEDNQERCNNLTTAIHTNNAELKELITKRYSRENEELIKKAIEKYIDNSNLDSFITSEIQELRVTIAEKLSELEDFHKILFDEARQAVAKIFCEISPVLFPEDSTLQDIYNKIVNLDADDDIVLIPRAIENMVTLQAPFYTFLYPSIRKSVFRAEASNWISSVSDRIKSVQNHFQKKYPNKSNWTPEITRNMVMQTIIAFQDLGIEWADRTETLLQSDLKIPGIICAALERLGDCIARSKEAKLELGTFIDCCWAEIQNNTDSYLTEIKEKIKSMSDIIID